MDERVRSLRKKVMGGGEQLKPWATLLALITAWLMGLFVTSPDLVVFLFSFFGMVLLLTVVAIKVSIESA